MIDDILDEDWTNAVHEQWYREEMRKQRRRNLVILVFALLGVGAAIWGMK